jgi:uncharacterized protein YuzE
MKKIDGVYVRFGNEEFSHNEEISEGIIADISKDGFIIGIEVIGPRPIKAVEVNGKTVSEDG